ncbi:MAG: RloB family protein [Eubacteriales bacterium]|nr:RloB family protein [Eubacteriales bacterium]
MTLKPKKRSDLKKIQNKMKLKESKMGTRYKLPPYTMIICEGVKTEPLYLSGFARKINEQYKEISKKEHIVVFGTGRNTKGLLNFVDRMVAEGKWKGYERFWLVYDKDDFPYDNFDNTQFSVEGREKSKIKVAWSNESIELWFLLHFQDYRSDNGRAQYIEKLKEYFDYSKTREDLYDVIMRKGSLEDAKRRAKKLFGEFQENGITSPSAMVPATRMYELVEELESYIRL